MLERESGEKGKSATRTQPADDRALESEAGVLGILWLTPEERFHPLRAGGVIGRSEECALRLDGARISRRHARVEREGSVWMLRDLESKNGSFVNAQRRELAPLDLQDTVRVGDWVGVVCSLPRAAIASGEYFRELVPGLAFGVATLATLAALPALARSDVPIILRGETGTGKELVARAIHALSGRSGQMVAINCSAIPESLAETELFGHQKGAFTGASDAAEGRIAAAQRGTLFLDEVVDLPLTVQSKLLRVLEERMVTPIGTSRTLPVDFRLIAASQVRLEVLVREGRFRGDLHARLNGAEIVLPPLRQRREEVPRLLCGALQRALGAAPVFDSSFVERVCSYSWPYNAREAAQLARLLAVSGKSGFTVGDLPSRFLDGPLPAARDGAGDAPRQPRQQRWLTRYAAELGELKTALRECAGNVTEAARVSGIPRHRARRLLEAEAALARRV